MKLVKSQLHEKKLQNPSADIEELQLWVNNKLKSLGHIQNSAGGVMLTTSLMAGSPFLNHLLFGAKLTGTTSWAMTAGAYTAVAAAIVVAMTSQVSNEIKHEQKKLRTCGEKYTDAFNQYNNIANDISLEVASVKGKTQKITEIQDLTESLIQNYLTLGLKAELSKTEIDKFNEEKILISKLIKTFEETHGENEILNLIKQQIFSMELL